jgi:hypothetical protein
MHGCHAGVATERNTEKTTWHGLFDTVVSEVRWVVRWEVRWVRGLSPSPSP